MEDSNHEAGLCKFPEIGVNLQQPGLVRKLLISLLVRKIGSAISDCELKFSLGQ